MRPRFPLHPIPICTSMWEGRGVDPPEDTTAGETVEVVCVAEVEAPQISGPWWGIFTVVWWWQAEEEEQVMIAVIIFAI